MGQMKKEDISGEAIKRRQRIYSYMTEDPPVNLKDICKMEGLHERAGRALVKEIEQEHGLKYMGVHSKPPRDAMPFGLTKATQRLRGKLADHLYNFREYGKNGGSYSRNEVAALVGLNNREQLKAEQCPNTHDWTLCQIERLARGLGRDPHEFLLSCLTT